MKIWSLFSCLGGRRMKSWLPKDHGSKSLEPINVNLQWKEAFIGRSESVISTWEDCQGLLRWLPSPVTRTCKKSPLLKLVDASPKNDQTCSWTAAGKPEAELGWEGPPGPPAKRHQGPPNKGCHSPPPKNTRSPTSRARGATSPQLKKLEEAMSFSLHACQETPLLSAKQPDFIPVELHGVLTSPSGASLKAFNIHNSILGRVLMTKLNLLYCN